MTCCWLVMPPIAWWYPDPGPWLAGGTGLGVLTDLVDEILTRRLTDAGPPLRRFESQILC
ncbi:MAG: hypothetical protein JWO38_6456 [Gemmataceae bacterium]|nr:hypothetical protein [Gemmataceae bacterium]